MSIYLDNAATSWPKCPQVLAAMQQYLCECGGSPGRALNRGTYLTTAIFFVLTLATSLIFRFELRFWGAAMIVERGAEEFFTGKR